tara:strand:- start:7807 stop:8835 length:1029 start_codon:yes stop_codon:yes gene_type:complete
MRKGTNLNRDMLLEDIRVQHQIIIPFFASNDPYYQDSLEILGYTLRSIKINSLYHYKLTLVVNGVSSDFIKNEIYVMYLDGYIDELVFENQAIGKVNSILKILRSIQADYVTISDADVLFQRLWDKAVFSVFDSFKKAGAVSPTPVYRTQNRLTQNIWFDYFFSKRLSFTKVQDSEGLENFAKSIGWPWLDQKYKDLIMTIRAPDGRKAVIGNSHFCVTYRASVFNQLPKTSSDYLLGGNSEDRFLDRPVVKCDLYRLATTKSYVRHMGNKIEAWMSDYGESGIIIKKYLDTNLLEREASCKPLTYIIKFKLFTFLTRYKGFIKFLYKNKGLPNSKFQDFDL